MTGLPLRYRMREEHHLWYIQIFVICRHPGNTFIVTILCRLSRESLASVDPQLVLYLRFMVRPAMLNSVYVFLLSVHLFHYRSLFFPSFFLMLFHYYIMSFHMINRYLTVCFYVCYIIYLCMNVIKLLIRLIALIFCSVTWPAKPYTVVGAQLYLSSQDISEYLSYWC